MPIHNSVKRVTTHILNEMKLKGEKIAMLTAYDYSLAKILDQAGIDVVLVGDSASNVMAGHETTIPITLNEMIYHASSVVISFIPVKTDANIYVMCDAICFE
jgi:3-methyl-2-oxobutanoate hydroxymethyltransferase